MAPRWTTSLAVLLVMGSSWALIPQDIYQCYKEENYPLFNRQNRQGMSMDQLIGLIEKLEHSSSGQLTSPQRLSAALLKRFRYDGIIDQNVNSDIASYVDPFTFIQPENAKFQMLQRLINLDNAHFPEEEFTLEEKCTMHWLLSHSVNETAREDEDDFCGQAFRRRRRRRRRAARRYGSRTSGSASSGQTAGGFVGNVVDEDASGCPLEMGVVYSPYGTVAAGSLVAGLAAGLSEQEVSVEDVVGSDTITLQGLTSEQRQLQINNIWAATLSGDIAQTALHYEGGGQNRAPSVLGPRGFWNCTYCPHEYNMPDRDTITAMTNAEIYGGIDGYLLGSQLSAWSHHTGFSLSTVLRMYYSPEGVSYDRRYRACDRLTNFRDSDLVDQDKLQEQAVHFGFAYYAADIGRMPMLSQDSLDEGMETLMQKVMEELNSFADNSMVDDGPGCRDVPAAGEVPSEPVCDTMADLLAVVDPAQGDMSIQAQKVFLSELALGMNIGWNKSYMHVVNGLDGEVLIDKWNYTNKAQLACDVQRMTVMTGSQDLVSTLDKLIESYADMLDQEAADGVARSNAQVLLLMKFGSRLDNVDDITTMLNALCDTFPDLNIFTLSDNKNVFLEVQQNMDRRQFSVDNMFATESNQQGIRETLVPAVISNMCQSPSRFVYPACHTDEARFENYNEDHHEYTYYVQPRHVTYLRLGPQQFLSSSDLKIQFESTYGSLQFCCSREDPLAPADGDDVTCMTTESTSSSQVEFVFSTPCAEDQMNDDCPPFYFSIQQNPDVSGSGDVNLCSDDECPFPDSIRYTIKHENMRCNSAGAVGASLLLLAASVCLRKLLL